MHPWFWTLAVLIGAALIFIGLFTPRRGLRVLMYHQVHPSRQDWLTVSTAQFERQLQYLKAQGYQCIGCRDLIEHLQRQRSLPAKALLITLDDGYLNNLEHAYPLLRKHGLRAAVFLPVCDIGQTNRWDGGAEPLMNYEHLRQLAPDVVELGVHGFAHANYRRLSRQEIAEDLGSATGELTRRGVPFVPLLAYPYGAYPKQRTSRLAMHDLLHRSGFAGAFRIGNRVNRLPLREPYEIKRIDIRGTDSWRVFQAKLRRGRAKWWPF